MCTRVTSFADENFRFPANLARHAHTFIENLLKINYPIICGTVEKLRVQTTSGCVLPFCFPTNDTRPTAPRHIGREIVSHKIESYRGICERLIHTASGIIDIVRENDCKRVSQRYAFDIEIYSGWISRYEI